MFDNGVFFFRGSKIFEERNGDMISRLPLELACVIFSKLDDNSLHIATRCTKVWRYIITSDMKLRRRLNNFELVITLGSESLVKFYKNNKRRLKKERMKNYLTSGESKVDLTKVARIKSKRKGEDIEICAKRYKLF